jgi:hypothetical protein
VKLLLENWREYLSEEEALQDIIVTVDQNGELNIPKSGDFRIDSIVSDILATIGPEDLKPKYRKLQKQKKCNKLTGHCFVATEVFWELTKRLEQDYSYVPCFIKHEGDSHWFAKDIKTGHIVDPTAGQFKEIPDYSLAKCDTKEKASASRYMMRRKDPYGGTTPTQRTLNVLSRMDDGE